MAHKNAKDVPLIASMNVERAAFHFQSSSIWNPLTAKRRHKLTSGETKTRFFGFSPRKEEEPLGCAIQHDRHDFSRFLADRAASGWASAIHQKS